MYYKILFKHLLFYRTLKLFDTEFNLDNSKINGSSEAFTEDSKTFSLPKSDNSQLKPLGDITITVNDIIPRMNSKIFIIFTSF